MNKYLSLYFVLMFVAAKSFSAVNIDSLIQRISNYGSDSASINKLVHLSEKYASRDEKAALLISRKAYELSEKSPDKPARFIACMSLGTRLLSQGIYLESASHFLEALKLAESLKSKEKIAKVCNSLGNLYGLQDQGETALPYYKKALDYYKQSHNRKRVATVLSNIGNIYYSQSGADKRKLSQAASYYLQVMEIERDLKDTSQMISNSNKMALVYTDMGKDRDALRILQESNRLCEVQDDRSELVYTYSYMGRAYNDLGLADSAIFYFNRSLDLAKEMSNTMMTADAFINLSESNEILKDYRRAFEYSKAYQVLHDSLLNSDNMKRIAEAQEQFEADKKERQIELLEISSKHDHLIKWALAGGAVLLLILVLLLFNRYSLKNRAHKLLEYQNLLIAQKNKDITDSINYARKIQDAMLPAIAEIKQALPETFLLYYPKDMVSGDFYWFLERPDRFILAVVDCTGHGVPGAFMSMIGNDMLYDAVSEKGLIDPGAILTSLNHHVKKSLRQNDAESGSRDGMDAAICVFDRHLNNLSFAGANRPLYLIRDSVLEIIPGTKSSIGGHTDVSQVFATSSIDLRKGDTLYIFSDGYCDQFGGESGKKFTTKRFRDLLLQIRTKSMAEQERDLKEHFVSWKRKNEQVDDVLVIGIRI
jgi:serine phosphatase RsbU (regulator of sigma subunit)